MILSAKELYFEAKGAIASFCRGSGISHREISPSNAEDVIAIITKERPLAIFLEPLANSYSAQVAEVGKIIDALSSLRRKLSEQGEDPKLADKSVYLVIDSTTLGPLASWKNRELSRLPNFMRVVNIESLLKFGEDGQDVTTAGIVTIIGEYADSQLEKIRRTRGFMPTEQTARRVDFSLDREALERRMLRHSRNTEVIAETLSKHITRINGFLEQPNHPHLESHPDHKRFKGEALGAGGLLNVGVDESALFDYRELHGIHPDTWEGKQMQSSSRQRVAEAFSILVTKLAGAVGLDLNRGTSFGFDTSRIAVYEYNKEVVEGMDDDRRRGRYLRIAPGTETIKDAILLAAVLRRADEIFVEALQLRRIEQLCEMLFQKKCDVVTSDSCL